MERLDKALKSKDSEQAKFYLDEIQVAVHAGSKMPKPPGCDEREIVDLINGKGLTLYVGTATMEHRVNLVREDWGENKGKLRVFMNYNASQSFHAQRYWKNFCEKYLGKSLEEVTKGNS